MKSFRYDKTKYKVEDELHIDIKEAMGLSRE